jgi:hypothetical protein
VVPVVRNRDAARQKRLRRRLGHRKARNLSPLRGPVCKQTGLPFGGALTVDWPLSLLSAPGRLVVKDAIMAGAALVTMADSAKAYLRKKNATAPEVTATAR